MSRLCDRYLSSSGPWLLLCWVLESFELTHEGEREKECSRQRLSFCKGQETGPSMAYRKEEGDGMSGSQAVWEPVSLRHVIRETRRRWD